MGTTLQDRPPAAGHRADPWRGLPAAIRAIYVTNRQRTGGWLAEAFAADSAVVVNLEEVVGMAAGIARLREEAFDVVFVAHEPGSHNALSLIEGYRAGGADEPIIVLGTQSEQELAAQCYEVGADAYLCVHTATTRMLIWIAARAIRQHQLLREYQRLVQAEQLRLQREHEETAKLLRQQRAMLQQLQLEQPFSGIDPQDEGSEPLSPPKERQFALPEPLVAHYRELLRTYVIMGSGNLSAELSRLAQLLVKADLGAQQSIRLHLRALEEIIAGLGSRSTRHVMSRADLLAIELLARLADGYRNCYRQQIEPPVQRRLPGFD